MQRFDEKGMMVFPNPLRKEFTERRKILVVKDCLCPQGHNMVNSRAIFHGYRGMMIGIEKQDGKKGMVALSPIYGEKTRIAIDIDLEPKELVRLFCPICDTPLPVLAKCFCGGELQAAFTSLQCDFSHSLAICNRVDCSNATLRSGGDIITLSSIDTL